MYRKAVEDNSQGGESRNPALSAKADAEKIMIKMSSLLGFDPVSRRRNPVETEEEDELDRESVMSSVGADNKKGASPCRRAPFISSKQLTSISSCRIFSVFYAAYRG